MCRRLEVTEMKLKTRFVIPFLLSLAAAPAVLPAADLRDLSNEELMQMDPRQMSVEEREQFRTEMRQRLQNMTPEEQEAFRSEMRGRRGGGTGGGGGKGGGQGGGY